MKTVLDPEAWALVIVVGILTAIFLAGCIAGCVVGRITA